MKALILAAGNGERLRPLTDRIPKPMVKINHKPILEYLILLCKLNKITDIAINTSFYPEKIKEYFKEGNKFGVELNYSYEKELLGTSGALNNFKDFFDDTFYVIYGDNITNLNLVNMLKEHKEKNAFATLFLYNQTISDEKTTPGLVIVDENKNIIQIVENPTEAQKKELSKISERNKFTNSGIYILDKEILKYIPEGKSDFSKDIFPLLIKEGKKIVGYTEECYIREVGQLSRYSIAKEEIEKKGVLKGFFN